MKPDNVYVDPSAIVRLYLHQQGSREMAAWRARVRGPLAVTHHGRTEIINAICRAGFLRILAPEALSEALSDLHFDFAKGHLWQTDILWRGALARAAELSQRYTPTLGTRSLDVLHVACALELKLSHFLTFDLRQRQLATKVGLKVVRP